jgi:hypothetical protein
MTPSRRAPTSGAAASCGRRQSDICGARRLPLRSAAPSNGVGVRHDGGSYYVPALVPVHAVRIDGLRVAPRGRKRGRHAADRWAIAEDLRRPGAERGTARARAAPSGNARVGTCRSSTRVYQTPAAIRYRQESFVGRAYARLRARSVISFVRLDVDARCNAGRDLRLVPLAFPQPLRRTGSRSAAGRS